MRKAFSMITAIFVMVILAAISALVLNTAGQITQNTVLQYRQEQAALLAKSYTEFAIMSILDHNKDAAAATGAVGSCVEDISGTVDGATNGFTVNVHIYYIGNNLPCTNGATAAAKRILNTGELITQNATAGTAYSPDVIIDAFVSYTDPLNPTENITYHRRSLQKI